jgi:hypothetical protein
MGKFSAVAFIITIMVPLPAVAYTQNDVDACTPDAMRLCWNAIPDAGRVTNALFKISSNSAPPAATCSIGHVAQVSIANAH